LKPVRFTPHALEKLSLTRRQGFSIDEETVVAAVRKSLAVFPGFSGRLIAQAVLDEEHVLRVVYEEDEEIIVITLYPGRRQRYES
jgi:hypothetical protein